MRQHCHCRRFHPTLTAERLPDTTSWEGIEHEGLFGPVDNCNRICFQMVVIDIQLKIQDHSLLLIK